MDSRAARRILKILKENVPHKTASMEQLRSDFSEFYLRFQSAGDAALQSVAINGVPAFWVNIPGVSSDRVILFFHGGGFTLGSTRDHIGLCAALARASGARLLSVDYRLAPEHPFPANINDSFAAYEWLLKNGFAADKIIPAGISGGGTLVLTTLIGARDQGLPLPVAGVCMSPAVDLLWRGKSVLTHKEKDWITAERLKMITEVYMAGQDPEQPIASPLFADLHGLPPLLIQVGSHELLLDDVRAFADKAGQQGVKIHLEVLEGMFHCWQIFARDIPEGRQAIERIAAFIKAPSNDPA